MTNTPTDLTPPPDHERHAVIVHLTDAQIEVIAERVESRFYARVGKKVVEKVLWAIGFGALALMAWLAARGELPK